MEDREVESETKFDWITSLQFNVVCLLVSCQCFLLDIIQFKVSSIFTDIPIVVTLHLDKESPTLSVIARLCKYLLVDDGDDAFTVSNQLVFDLTLVAQERGIELGILRVLFNSGNSTTRSSLR